MKPHFSTLRTAALLILMLAAVTRSYAECEDDCPKLSIETQTNLMQAIRASKTYTDYPYANPPNNTSILIVRTNGDLSGSEWTTGIPAFSEVTSSPTNLPLQTISGFTGTVNKVLAYNGSAVTNLYLSEGPNMEYGYLGWLNSWEVWGQYDPAFEWHDDETSYSVHYVETRTNAAHLYETTVSDLTVEASLVEATWSYVETHVFTTSSNGVFVSSSTTVFEFSVSVSDAQTKYVMTSTWTVDSPDASGTATDVEDISIKQLRPTQYRVHFVGKPGKPYDFTWPERPDESYGNEPYPGNFNFPKTTNHFRFAHGTPSEQNPNNGTLPLPNGEDWPGEMDGEVNVVGGASGGGTMGLGVLGDSTVLNPGYDPTAANPVMKGSASVSESKQSFKTVGTGRVQHSPWYRPASIDKPMTPMLRSALCTSCTLGHDKAEPNKFEIELGPGPGSGSAGHVEVNPVELLGAARPAFGAETNGVDSGVDEYCILNPETKRHGHVGHGIAVGNGPGSKLTLGALPRIKTQSTLTEVASEPDVMTVTMYQPVAPSGQIAQWRIEIATNANPRTVRIIKSALGHVPETNTYAYDAGTRELSFSGALSTTVRATTIVDGGFEDETITNKNNFGVVSHVTKHRYQEFAGVGRLLVQSIEDPDDAALTTTRDYYTDPNEPGRAGRLRTVVSPTGGWTRYEYDDYGRTTREITGRNDTPLTETLAESTALITENYYYDYEGPEPQLPRLTLVKIGTTTISKTTASVTTNFIRYTRYAKPEGSPADPDNLVDTVWPCTEGAVWTLGKVRKIEYAGGQREVHFYEFPTADTVVETILYGEPDPANVVNVLKGTRTLNVTRANGRILSKKMQDLETGVTLASEDYSNFDKERPGHVTYLDGSFATMTYACCGLDTVTRSDGSSVTYDYDAQKRLQYEHHTVAGRTLTLAYTYNADDEVIGVTRTWFGESSTPMSGVKFDLAGRVLKSTNQLLNVVTSYGYEIDSETGEETITTTYPNLSTKIETYNRDGSLATVAGTAVAPGRYTNGVESVDSVNRLFTQQFAMNQGGTDSGYWSKRYLNSDWQSIKATTSATNLVQFRYAKGRLTKVVNADGFSLMRTYDNRGLPEFSVLDMHSGGILDTNLYLEGSNRVSKTESVVIASDPDENGPVYRVRSYVWPTVGADTSRLAGEVKVSIDGRRVWKTIFNNGTPVTSKSAIGFDAVTKKYFHTNTAPMGTKTMTVTLNGLQLESKTVEANGTVLRHQTNGYDAHNRLATVWDERNGTTTIHYNATNDLIESVVSPVPESGGQAQTTTYYYNEFGQLFRTVLPDNSSITNEYHPNGLLAKRSGSQTYATGFAYDDAGRQTHMTNWADPNSPQVTCWFYEPSSGLLKGMRYPDKTSGATPATLEGGKGEDYTYTFGGRLKTKKSARDVTTSYDYNRAGQLAKVLFDDNATPGITNGYNRLGRLTTIQHAEQVISRSYNDAGELLTEAYTGGPLSGKSVTRTYNDYLQRASMTALDGATTLTGMEYGYTKVTLGHGAPQDSTPQTRLQSVSGGPTGVLFDYEANSSLVKQLTYGGGDTVWIERTMQYDFLNRLKQISTQSGDTHNYQFDTLNRRTKDTLGDGSRWEYAYDELGQLTGATNFAAGGSVSLNNVFTYTSDGIGNVLTAKAVAIGGGETFSFSPNRQNQITSLAHSDKTPLIGKVNAAATLTVLSDQNYPAVQARQGEDFRVRLTTGVTGSDRYLHFTNIAVLNGGGNPDIVTTNRVNLFSPKDTSETIVYDDDGNLTSDGRWDYTWDALNRLTKMESKADAPQETKHSTTFTYDAGGRRIGLSDSYWTNGTREVNFSRTFLYDGWDLVAEYQTFRGTTSLVRSYGWLGKSGGLLWMKDHATSTYYVPSFDGNRNITKLIKYPDQTVAAEYDYTPYGGLLRATGPMALSNPFRFSSEYHDDVTGLVYYGHRYYSPQTRRWLSKDPIGFYGGINLYGFVGNDPINNWDELGFCDGNKNKDNNDEDIKKAKELAEELASRAMDPLGVGNYVGNKWNDFKQWVGDSAREGGQGLFDFAMGERSGQSDPNGNLRMLAEELDMKNDVARDAAGELLGTIADMNMTAADVAMIYEGGRGFIKPGVKRMPRGRGMRGAQSGIEPEPPPTKPAANTQPSATLCPTSAARKPSPVIGGNMKERVKPHAESTGGHYYKPKGEWTLEKNKRWAKDMKRQIDKGERKPVDDIGPDPDIGPTESYLVERNIFFPD